MDNASVIRGKHSPALRLLVATRARRGASTSTACRPAFDIGISLDSPFPLGSRNFPGGASGGQIARAEDLLATLAGFLGSAEQTSNIRDRTSGFVPGLELRRRYSFNSLAAYVSDNWKIAAAA